VVVVIAPVASDVGALGTLEECTPMAMPAHVVTLDEYVSDDEIAPALTAGCVTTPPTPFVQTSVLGAVAVVARAADSAVAMNTISLANPVVTLAVSPAHVEPVTPVPAASKLAVVVFPTSTMLIAYVVDPEKFT